VPQRLDRHPRITGSESLISAAYSPAVETQQICQHELIHAPPLWGEPEPLRPLVVELRQRAILEPRVLGGEGHDRRAANQRAGIGGHVGESSASFHLSTNRWACSTEGTADMRETALRDEAIAVSYGGQVRLQVSRRSACVAELGMDHSREG